MSPRPTARVVIVNWRQSGLTQRACESILPQLGRGDDLVVVDNASGDGSAQRLRDAGLTVVETAENLGFGGGVNAGARGMTQDVLVLLNNDAVARPGFLDALCAPLGPDGDPRLGATTALVLLEGRWRPAGGDEPALTGPGRGRWVRVGAREEAAGRGEVLVNSTGNEVDRSGNGYDRDWLVPLDRLSSPPEVFGVYGGACAIRAGVWHELGGLREDLFLYYEDTDLSWRLRRAGYRVEMVRGAVALHAHSASSRGASRMLTRLNARNRVLVAAEHAPWPVALAALARTGARAGRHGLRGPVAVGLGQALRRLPGAMRRRRLSRRSEPSR